MLHVLDYRLAATGTALDLLLTDSVLVSRDGIAISSGGGIGIYGQGSNHWVMVEGVAAGFFGVRLGDSGSSDSNETVLVSATGIVTGTSAGLMLTSYASSVTNYGMIEGNVQAIYAGGVTNTGFRLENFGTVHSNGYGLASGGLEKMTILNAGTISGGTAAIFGSAQDDSLRNTGKIFGDVLLGGGSDYYDGRKGSVEGLIDGGAGDDFFVVGAGDEIITGGEGIDTLVFRKSEAINVALDGSFANTGVAQYDDYLFMENIIGSAFGSDRLTGNDTANQLSGLGGADKLSGGGSADTLTGGVGKDVLTGGLGDDRFAYYIPSHGGDRITDFGNGAGNDDAFLIEASPFGGGLSAGALAVSRFQTRADNVAQDANDRFIFNTATHTLWFDVNGNGAGGLTLLATLQASAVLSAADILLI